MFTRNKNEKDDASEEVGLLGIDTRFEGSIRFRGTLRIDGQVLGNIVSKGQGGSMLIVNREAVVTGDIVSDSVLISGRVVGNVSARERVEIYRTGYLKGDVHTADIMIEGGAEFDGYCHMIEEESPLSQDIAGKDIAGKNSAGGKESAPAPPGKNGGGRDSSVAS